MSREFPPLPRYWVDRVDDIFAQYPPGKDHSDCIAIMGDSTVTQRDDPVIWNPATGRYHELMNLGLSGSTPFWQLYWLSNIFDQYSSLVATLRPGGAVLHTGINLAATWIGSSTDNEVVDVTDPPATGKIADFRALLLFLRSRCPRVGVITPLYYATGFAVQPAATQITASKPIIRDIADMMIAECSAQEIAVRDATSLFDRGDQTAKDGVKIDSVHESAFGKKQLMDVTSDLVGEMWRRSV